VVVSGQRAEAGDRTITLARGEIPGGEQEDGARAHVCLVAALGLSGLGDRFPSLRCDRQRRMKRPVDIQRALRRRAQHEIA
jgi:hypothetical protein